jgi:hypothetical protein
VTVVVIALYLMFGILDVVFYEPRVNMLSWLLLAGVYGVSRGSYATSREVEAV